MARLEVKEKREVRNLIMAKIGKVENGLRKHRKAKRRNPVAVAKVAKKNPARRAISAASVKSYAKRNGLKLVSKSVANPKRRKHRKHRRNGLATVTSSRSMFATKRNGLLGNSKHDAQNVAALGGGLFLTKFIGNFVSGYVQPILAKIGLGNYSNIITNAGIAIVVIPMIAKRTIPKQSDMLRLGGLFATGLSILEQVAPSVLSQINPFNTSPIIMTSNGAAIPPSTVSQIAAGVAASDNPVLAAARVGSAMNQLDTAGAQGYARNFLSSVNDPQVVL